MNGTKFRRATMAMAIMLALVMSTFSAIHLTPALAAPLSGLSISPSHNRPSDSSTNLQTAKYTVQFNPGTKFAVKEIEIDFPDGAIPNNFVVTGAKLDNVVNIPRTASLSIDGASNIVTVVLVKPTILRTDRVVLIDIAGIVHPEIRPLTTKDFSISVTTKDRTDTTIDGPTSASVTLAYPQTVGGSQTTTATTALGTFPDEDFVAEKIRATDYLKIGTSTITITGSTNTISTDVGNLIFDAAGDIQLSDNLVPTADNAKDIGSALKRWRSAYLGTSLIVGGTTTYADKSITTAASGVDDSLTIKTADDDKLVVAESAGASEGSGLLRIVGSGEGVGDLLLEVLDTSGSTVFKVDEDGDVQMDGTLQVGASITLNGMTNTISTSGTTLTVDDALDVSGDVDAGANTVHADFMESSTAATDLTLSGAGAGIVKIDDDAKVTGTLQVGASITLNGMTNTISTSGTTLTVDDALDVNAILKTAKGADVASAAQITLGDDGNVFKITGTLDIETITIKDAGTIVVLIFTDILMVADGSNLKLDGNFFTTANDTLTLVSDGTHWFEVTRSPN